MRSRTQLWVGLGFLSLSLVWCVGWLLVGRCCCSRGVVAPQSWALGGFWILEKEVVDSPCSHVTALVGGCELGTKCSWSTGHFAQEPRCGAMTTAERDGVDPNPEIDGV